MNHSTLAVTVLILIISFCHKTDAANCTASNCLLANGCVCASSSSPLSWDVTPQFVMLTFDDAVTEYIYTNYYNRLLNGRRNNDSSPVSATFFVPHEYSDYERVHDLYVDGHEIALNSLSNNKNASYWALASEETLVQEFGGERQLIAHFANISIQSIVGVRTPDLQINGNITFQAYNDSGILYDNSWPTSTKEVLYPYTLDYLSYQKCPVGRCPDASFPGLWVVPILNLMRPNDTYECNVIVGCQATGNATQIFDWLKTEFIRNYNGTKAPLPLLLNAAWFDITGGSSLEGLELFLDYLEDFQDVFVVSIRHVIEWMKNPVSIKEYNVERELRNATCVPRVCMLASSETEIRYMKSCVTCPAVYPWLGNPLGQAT